MVKRKIQSASDWNSIQDRFTKYSFLKWRHWRLRRKWEDSIKMDHKKVAATGIGLFSVADIDTEVMMPCS